MSLFTGIKQAALAAGAKHVFNKQIERYGVMPSLHINLTDRHFEGDIILKGETAAIHFSADYLLDPDAVSPTITLTSLTLSRPWMQALAEDFIVNKPQPLPVDAAKWLRRLGVM